MVLWLEGDTWRTSVFWHRNRDGGQAAVLGFIGCAEQTRGWRGRGHGRDRRVGLGRVGSGRGVKIECIDGWK